MPKSDPPPPTVLAETFESTPSTSDPTFKYYQVAVPSFSFNQTGDQTGVTRTVANVVGNAGSSFVRLGSFPDVTNPSMGPAGFGASLKLANLVGEATGIAGEGEDASPSTYGGDPNYLLGFADDTRVHQSTVTPGKPETAILLTKGGWWDHSDGNRITTTAGDKIEIIQGNYKMVVMGRQQAPGSMLIRDVSGGIVEEQGPAPSPCIKTVEWVGDEGGTYSLYQNNGLGNVYTSFYGETGDLYAGPVKESWTGQAPAAFPKSPFYINSQAQRAVEGAATTAPDTVITDYTWAASITTYTGSVTKPVPTITEWTFADTITTNNGTAAMPIGTTTETTWVGSTASTTTVSGTVTETTTVAGAVTETSTLGSTTATTTVSGAITETTTAAAITGMTTAAAITDMTTATTITGMTTAVAITDLTMAAQKMDVFLGGLILSLQIAAKEEIFIGPRLNMNLGPALDITIPEVTSIGPSKTEMRLEKLETSVKSMRVTQFATTRCLIMNVIAGRITLGT